MRRLSLIDHVVMITRGTRKPGRVFSRVVGNVKFTSVGEMLRVACVPRTSPRRRSPLSSLPDPQRPAGISGYMIPSTVC